MIELVSPVFPIRRAQVVRPVAPIVSSGTSGTLCLESVSKGVPLLYQVFLAWSDARQGSNS